MTVAYSILPLRVMLADSTYSNRLQHLHVHTLLVLVYVDDAGTTQQLFTAWQGLVCRHLYGLLALLH
jgi:hypothetical protein